MRFELATSSLTRRHSTAELLLLYYGAEAQNRDGDHHVWRMKEIVREVSADGLVFSPVYQCRSFAGLPTMVKQTAEKDLGVPTMYLETGAFDGRDHTYDTMKTKIETFTELLKVRKVTKTELVERG